MERLHLIQVPNILIFFFSRKQPKSLLFILMTLVFFFTSFVVQARSDEEERTHIDYLYRKASEFQQGEPDSLYFYAHRLFKESRAKGNLNYIAESALLLARYFYSGYSNKDSALYYNDLSSEYFTQLKDTSRIAGNYIRRGSILKRGGELEPAVEAYFKALHILEESGDSSLLSMTLNNIGSVYREMDDFETAEDYTFRSLEIRKRNADTLGIAYCYQSLANHYGYQNQFDKATEYLYASLELFQRLGMDSKIAALYNNLGTYKEKSGDLDGALEAFEKALESQENLYSLTLLHSNISGILVKKGEYALAKQHAIKADELGKKIGASQLRVDALANLYRVYKNKGNLRKEYETYKLRDSIFYSIQLQDVEKTIAALELKYNKEKVEKALIQQKAENKEKTQERNMFLMISLALLILFVAAVLLYLQKRKNMILLDKQKKLVEQKNYEKGVLMQELHHRVKNNLQLVSSLLSLQSNQMKNAQAAGLVKESQGRVEAMTMIHQALYRGEQNTHIDMKDFLLRLVENLRYAYSYEREALQFTHQIEEVSVMADQAIPLGLILNELLCNVFKHAYQGIEKPQLHLEMHRAEHVIHIVVRDNGLGLKTEPSDNSDSFGRQLIKSLVRQLKGQLNSYNEGGCVSELSIPLESMKQATAGAKSKTTWQKYESYSPKTNS